MVMLSKVIFDITKVKKMSNLVRDFLVASLKKNYHIFFYLLKRIYQLVESARLKNIYISRTRPAKGFG